jgi:predicted DNA-binding protein
MIFMYNHDIALFSMKGIAMKTQPIATRLPAELTEQLDAVCKKLGLRKNFVLETALREKLEDLLDAADLQLAIKEATGFHAWGDIKRENRRKSGKRSV